MRIFYLTLHYNLLYMSQFLIYVPLEKHLSEWLTHHLGDPVAFPAYSNENAVIRAFLQKLPPGKEPELNDGTMTAIVIPDSSAKPPETYNYIGRKAKKAIREAIRDLFLRALWSDISPLEKSAVGLNALIAAWCESHGIGVDRIEAVRQCYYRVRQSYARKDINLRKSSKPR